MSTEQIKNKHIYEKAAELWANCDHWTLTDAFRLARDHPPFSFDNTPLDNHEQNFVNMWVEVAKNCAGKSLSTIIPSPLDTEHRVEPIEFLRWAYFHNFSIPEMLQSNVEQRHNRLVGKGDNQLRNNQRRREMCRGIASLLWETHPTMTIKKMAERPEIFTHGCEGHSYTQETVENWIRKQCPEPKVGRPKNT